jgi:AraC-like DNA-binding protein
MTRASFTAEDAVLPAYFPGILLRLMLEQGYREEDLLRGTGLAATMFFEDHFRLNFVQHQRLIENTLLTSEDVHLGIRFGKSVDVTALGIVGYAAQSCRNLEAALKTIARYFPTRTPLLEMSLSTEGNSAVVEIVPSLELGTTRYFVLGAMVCGIERALAWYLGGRNIVSHATLACPKPAESDHIDARFGFPVQFESPVTRVYFSSDWLEFQLAMANPQNEQSARQFCEQLLARMGERRSIVALVREYLLQQCGTDPGLTEAARHFRVSPRTLRRDLSKAGTTFKSVVDEVRSRLAIEHLSTGRDSIYDIANKLGYADLSNFNRAFKRWTGTTPSEFRKRI